MKSNINNIGKKCTTQVGAVAKFYEVITFSCFSDFKYNYISVEDIILNHMRIPAHVVFDLLF